MFKRFRKLVDREPEPAVREPPAVPRPASQFNTLGAWLAAWVEFRREQAVASNSLRETVPGGFPLVGSIGLDTAVTADGRIWIQVDDLSETNPSPWRLATERERTSILVSAQMRYWPELALLLPLRPLDAIDCSGCNGTGYLHADIIWCSSCGCLGWVHANGA